MSPALALLSATLTVASGVPAGAAPGLLPAFSAPAGGARAEAATAPLLGAPYLASPLGEGSGPDPDPRFRLDAFDCMTFVETAVALGSARSLDDAALALDDVRYAATPSLAGRNHEVLSQWIPSNLAKGWIVEATRAIAGSRTRREEKVYDPAVWSEVRRAGRAIAGLPRERLPAGRFGVDVVPPEDLPAITREIPAGTLVFLVRADRPDRSTRITHAGLIVSGPAGERLVRHATRSTRARRVIQEPVDRFLLRQAAGHPGWPVVGLAFFSLPDQEARVAALARRAAAAPATSPGAAVPSPTAPETARPLEPAGGSPARP